MTELERFAKIRQYMPLIKNPHTTTVRKLEMLEELRPALGEDEFMRNIEPIKLEAEAVCKKLKQLGFSVH